MKDIDYGQIIKRSWELTWKNKWLWVVGLVLAIFGGGSSYSSNGGSSSSTKFPSASPSPSPQALPSQLNMNGLENTASHVLGAATNTLVSWFKSIPPEYWLILVLGVLVFAIFSAGVVWVIKSWATGALISGLDDADNGQKVDLKTMTPKGIAKIKDLIIFDLVSFGMVFLAVLGLGIVVGIGFLLKALVPVIGLAILILLSIVAVLAFIVAVFLFSMLVLYAQRLIVLKGYKAWDAWKKGLSLTKGNFLPTIIMGIVNGVIGCLGGCGALIALVIVFGIPGFLLIYPVFSHGFHFPSVGTIIGIVILFLLFGSAYNLVRAVLVVFSYGNWNLFFKQIIEREENDKQ